MEGYALLICSCLCICQRNSKDRICTQLGLVLCAVRIQHDLVDLIDIGSVLSDQKVSDDVVDIVNSLGHALAFITVLVVVTKLQCLKLACGCTARNRCHTDCAAGKLYLCLNGRVGAGIQDLTRMNPDDSHKLIHVSSPPLDIYLYCFAEPRTSPPWLCL